VALGRRTLTRSIWAVGLEQKDWSAEYRLHSQRKWDSDALFDPIIGKALDVWPGDWVTVAFDDTGVRKAGRKIPHCHWQKDPLSPPFRANLRFGLRYLQGSLILPLYRLDSTPPRGIPIALREVAPVKKPGRKASPSEWATYHELRRSRTLPHELVRMLDQVRTQIDQAGGCERQLVAVVDGSFCNRVVFRADLERTTLVARARKDAKLCLPATTSSRVYAEEKFTPEQVRSTEDVPYKKAEIYHGAAWREVRYKEVNRVLWQRGSGRRPIRLLVVAPVPYRTTRHGTKVYYRHPAYLLTTDITSPAERLLQAYFDRWQIEVNFREEKDTLGLCQAQVRTLPSLQRQPALLVASYAALLLAGLDTFGTRRSDDYLPLPKWRRNAIRPSCLDLITVLRAEISREPRILLAFQGEPHQLGFIAGAAA